MSVIKVILPCKTCNSVGVVHKLNLEDVNLETGLPFSSHVRKDCYSCRDINSRDGPKRYGFNILARIESKEEEIRHNIFKTQVRVFSPEDIQRYEQQLKEQHMICNMGRSKMTLEHPVCSSCQEQGIKCPIIAKKKPIRHHYVVKPEINEGRKTLVISTKLDSPNAWTNQRNGQKIYRSIRKRWERLLTPHALPLWGSHKHRKRRISIIYYVNDGRQKIVDIDNLHGATKPIVDVLKRLNIFFDDTPGWLVRQDPQQIIDREIEESLVTITIYEMETPC